MNKPSLFEAYPELEGRVPWVELGTFPTPVERMGKLGEKLGHPNLWVKRDDLSADKMGGNKVRVMEHLLADMKRKGKKVAISPGALGSNQIMASAIWGHQLGLDIVGVFFKQCETDYMCKHMLIDKGMGVEFHHVGNPYYTPFVILYHYLRKVDWKKLETPFYIPSFGSSALCAVGYVGAMFELKKQIAAGQAPEPDLIFVTAGTGGTMAGIELGARLTGMKTTVIGVRITDYVALNEWMVASIVNRTCNYLRQYSDRIPPLKYRARDIHLIHDFFGGEYAKITPEGLEARAMARETDGLVVDTTYTAKTFAAMIQYINDHNLLSRNILFWHTYNTRDLAPFLDPKVRPADLPEEFQCYFGS